MVEELHACIDHAIWRSRHGMVIGLIEAPKQGRNLTDAHVVIERQ